MVYLDPSRTKRSIGEQAFEQVAPGVREAPARLSRNGLPRGRTFSLQLYASCVYFANEAGFPGNPFVHAAPRRLSGRRAKGIEESYPDRIGSQETKAMKQKRKLFDELMEGVDAMQKQREGKLTLRSHEVEDLPPLEVDADLIRDTRERMNVSRAVFARRLRVSTRTLENWEQGRARPNAQAAALILMVRKFPDTLEKLSELEHRAA
jgi:putative transcriptional regulator